MTAVLLPVLAPRHLWLLLLVLPAFVARPAAAQDPPPNVILILADDLGYGDLGAYGQRRFETPNLDRMAREGTRFTQFYAGSTVCAPSRWSLLTGTHTGSAYLRGNAGLSLREQDRTLPEVLQAAGYATAMFGKWGLGTPDDAGAPHRKGFDAFLGYLEHRHAHSYYTDHLFAVRDGRTERVPVDTTRYTHDLFVEAALAFVEANRDRPFFLYLPVTIPHAELLVPEEAKAPFLDAEGRSRMLPDPPFPCCGVIGTYRAQPHPHAAFAGMVQRLDRDVGRLLDRLDALGLAENTVVLFTSDNGPHDEGGADPGYFESNGPLRGLKRDLYEGGIRVPLLAWGPGRVPAGRMSDHPWAFWDLLPTLAGLAGAPVPDGVNGLSMVNLLAGHGPVPQHEYLYWEFLNGWSDATYVQAIRQGAWKLLLFRRPEGVRAELYDLDRDVGEYHNLADRYPDVVERLRALMDAAHVEPEEPRFRIPYR